MSVNAIDYKLQYADGPVVVGAGAPAEWRSLPAKPTEKMIAAGNKAGPVSVDVAWRIYRAILEAAQPTSPRSP
jgi:hypothetical protein